jgi:hypothetical protein
VRPRARDATRARARAPRRSTHAALQLVRLALLAGRVQGGRRLLFLAGQRLAQHLDLRGGGRGSGGGGGGVGGARRRPPAPAGAAPRRRARRTHLGDGAVHELLLRVELLAHAAGRSLGNSALVLRLGALLVCHF